MNNLYPKGHKKVTRKIYLLIIIGMFLIASLGLTSAHKLNDDYNLIVSSNNATDCNLTYIQYPNHSLTFYNIEMDQLGNDFSLKIIKNNYTTLGEHCMGVTCTDSLTDETGSVCETITPTGFINSIGYYILILIFSLGIIILGLWLRDAPITLLGSFGLYFLGLYILFYGLVDIRDPVYTWASGLIILGLAFYISTKSAHELITN